jgi:hypothetical protein
MKKRQLISLLVISSMMSSSISFAAANYKAPANVSVTSKQQYVPQYGQSYAPQTYVPPLQGYVFMVPAGTNIPTVTTSEINSADVSLGQSVCLALGHDFYYNGKLVAPAGSQVNGNVIMVRKGGRTGKNGQLQLRFTNILTPYGQMIPISGKIKSDDGKGILYAATAKDTAVDYAKDIAIGSAAGALMGTIMGPISGGKVGKGAALGTAVGAVGGLGKSLIDKGTDVIIPANSQIDITIDQPITINSNPRY